MTETTSAAQPEARLATYQLVRGAIGGLVAGVVFAMATMLWTTLQGPGPMAAFTMIASVPFGGAEPQPLTATTIALGGFIHMMLSIAYGALFAVLLPRRISTGAAYALGAAFGLGLYIVNFPILANLAFPVFLMAHQGFEAVVHVLFGVLLVPFLRRPVRS